MILNIHQKIIVSTTSVVFVLLMYDSLLHLLLGIGHVLFESAEYLLDLIIDHLFDTGTHETQVVVFYILVSIIFYALYRFYRFLPVLLHKLKQKLQWQKTETVAQWRALSVFWKLAWWSFFITAANCWLFLT